MKKYFKNIMLAAVAVLGMTTLAACSSSDDNPEEEQKPTSGVFVYNFYLSETVLKVADIKITYTDCSGKEITEEVTVEKCSKDITNGEAKEKGATMCYTKEIKATSLPATSGYKMKWTRTAEELTEEKYSLPYGMLVSFKPNIGSISNDKGSIHLATPKTSEIDKFINTRNTIEKGTYTANTEGKLEYGL